MPVSLSRSRAAALSASALLALIPAAAHAQTVLYDNIENATGGADTVSETQ